MKHYEVKLRIDTVDATTPDGLKRWLTCLGPASTVLDVRLVGESIPRPDLTFTYGEPGRPLPPEEEPDG